MHPRAEEAEPTATLAVNAWPRRRFRPTMTDKFPESYLIDATGKVRFRFVNKRDGSGGPALACIRSRLN